MTDPAFAARQEIRRCIASLTGDLGDPLSEDYDPLTGLAAAALLSRAASGAVRDHVLAARQAGRAWREIGEAYGPPARDGRQVFDLLAADLGDGPVFGWPCPSCTRVVADHGPGQGGPRDAERGHGDGCERFAATVAAWDRLRDEGSEEGDGDG